MLTNRLFSVINIMCSFNERSLCDATLNEFITRFSLFSIIANILRARQYALFYTGLCGRVLLYMRFIVPAANNVHL